MQCKAKKDLKTTHDEVGETVVTQAIYAANVDDKHVVLVANDTVTSVMLLYNYHKQSLQMPLRLASTHQTRDSMDTSK